MKRDYRTIFGLLLILAGVLVGLQQFNLLQGSWGDAVFVGLWALAALYFYDMYRKNENQWWFGLLTLIFGSMALGSGLDLVLPGIGDAIGGAIFLGAIGLGFLLVYWRFHGNWWALIPAGVMFTLAIIAIVDALPFEMPFESGALLFLGIGITFLVLSRIQVKGENLSWAIFPAVPLLLLGILIGFGTASSWNYVWPALIILFGVYFLVEAFRRK